MATKCSYARRFHGAFEACGWGFGALDCHLAATGARS